jgi:hypothetical protein
MKKNETNQFYPINSLNYFNLEENLNYNEKIKLKSKNNKKRIEGNNKNHLNLKNEEYKINKVKSFDHEINKINKNKENSIITNDFINRVMKTAYERYKEKKSLKKIHSQNELIFLKFS